MRSTWFDCLCCSFRVVSRAFNWPPFALWLRMEPHQYSEPCNAKRIQSQCPPRVSSRDEGRFPPSHLGSAAHCTVNSGAVAERRGMRLTEHHVSWVSENQMTEDCSTRHQVATVKREPKEAQNGHAARQSQHDVTFAAAAAAAAPSTSACTSLAAGEVLGCNPQLTSGSVNGSKRHWDATSASCGARSKTGMHLHCILFLFSFAKQPHC